VSASGWTNVPWSEKSFRIVLIASPYEKFWLFVFCMGVYVFRIVVVLFVLYPFLILIMERDIFLKEELLILLSEHMKKNVQFAVGVGAFIFAMVLLSFVEFILVIQNQIPHWPATVNILGLALVVMGFLLIVFARSEN